MTSIADILRSIRPLSRQNKIHRLRGFIASEKKRSIRKVELECALKRILNKQIKWEYRQDKREARAS